MNIITSEIINLTILECKSIYSKSNIPKLFNNKSNHIGM